ncbi:hypothetical protein D3C86_1951240 [compost metagenome]
MAGLGVGPAPVPFKHLTPARLSVALDETEAPRIRANARSLGEKISAERGVDAAIAFIERRAKA